MKGGKILNKKKKLLLFLCSTLVLGLVAVPCFATSGDPTVSTSDIAGIMSSVTSQFSVSNITTFIAYIIGACIALVFLWWAVRKAFRAITAAAMRGKARI